VPALKEHKVGTSSQGAQGALALKGHKGRQLSSSTRATSSTKAKTVVQALHIMSI